MKKVLSIIVPTYNMEKYLRKCLDSLIVSDENMQRLEVLVINDGSIDSSSQIAHEYEAKYPQTFCVIDKENGNYGSCINRGLKEATGKYVKILDADDSLDVRTFNDLFTKLARLDDSIEMIITDYYQVNESGTVTQKYNHTHYLPLDRIFGWDELLKSQDMIRLLVHQNITYKTEILRSLNYHQTEGISYTDNEWVFKPIVKVKRICYLPYNLYKYLRGRKGQTFDPQVLYKSYWQREIVMRSLVEYFSETCNTCSSSAKEFMKERLVLRLFGFYRYHLCVNGSKESNETLVNFDKFVFYTNKEVFACLHNYNSNFLHIPIIGFWSKKGYNRNLFLLKILRIKNRMAL